MDVNTMKEIFGAMSVDQLPGAKLVAQNNFRRNLMYVGFGVFFIAGIYVGIKLSGVTNDFLKPKDKIKKPENDDQ
jgi:hypothetical protein